MKRLIICLVALAFTACEFDFSINKPRIEIYDLSIECINEEVITIPGSAPATMNWHTFSCQGVVGGYEGDFYIQILYSFHFLLLLYNPKCFLIYFFFHNSLIYFYYYFHAL